jgi:purine-binding chemotaxis protein CheW
MSSPLQKDGRQSASTAPLEMCSVRVGQTLFGVPITHILEIVGSAGVQPVPLAPAYVDGLIHYRGDVLTTVSMRQLLNLPLIDALPDILVFDGESGYFGLLVDAVSEVLAVDAVAFEPNPSILDSRRRQLFAGAYKLKEGLLVMLDPARLDPMNLAAALVA